MKLRPATKIDASNIAEVHVASWRYAFKGIMQQDILDNLSVQETAKRWEGILEQNTGKVFVSEHGGLISGFVNARKYRYDDIVKPLPGEIASIYLAPQFIGQGVGAKLLQQGIAYLESEGLSGVAAWVLEANAAAITFYKAFGFDPDGASKIHRKSGLLALRYIRHGNNA